MILYFHQISNFLFCSKKEVSLVVYLGIFLMAIFQGGMTLYSLYLVSKGLSEYEVSLQASVFGLGGVGGAILGGVLGERFSSKRLAQFLCLSLLVAVIGLKYFGLPILSVFTFIFGIGISLNRSNFLLYFSNLSSKLKTESALSWRRLLLNLGVAAGAWFAGLFLNQQSFYFIVFCFLVLLVGLVINHFLPLIAPNIGGQGKGIVESAKNPNSLYWLCLILVLGLFPFALLPNIYLLHAKNNIGFSSEIAGRAFLINGLIIVVFQVPLNHILGRIKTNWKCCIGIILIGIGVTSVAFTQNSTQFFAGVLFWSLGEIILFVPLIQVFFRQSPFSSGKTIGIYQVCFAFSEFIFPLIGSQLLLISNEILWTLVFASSLMGGLLAVKFIKQ